MMKILTKIEGKYVILILILIIALAGIASAANDTNESNTLNPEDMLNASEQFYEEAKGNFSDLPPIVAQFERFMALVRSLITALNNFVEWAKGILPGV